MEHILVMNSNGVIFAGKLVFNNSSSDWLGIKLSEKSKVHVYINKSQIHLLYHENGDKEVFKKVDNTNEFTPETCIQQQNIMLIRVKGGVSYRGQLHNALIEEMEEGYWIAPTNDLKTILYIPNDEVEEKFSL